jgi:Effector-associated domain 1/Carboxypeptidase regulatory-like domain
MPLTGDQAEALREAILSGFNRRDLEELVRFGLGMSLEHITSDQSLKTAAIELIQWAEGHGRTDDLIRAVRSARPQNDEMQSVTASVLPAVELHTPNEDEPIASGPPWRPHIARAMRPTATCEAPSTDRADPGKQPLRVICPLHGIRTLAVWQKGLSDLASSHGWACRLDRWSYGRFSLPAFLTPWTREAKLNWLRRQYDAETHDRRLLIENGQAPSVVAHSFGTYILGYTLLRFDFVRFNKVILCGSILPRDFPWDKLIERGQVQAVRNEYGVRDPWVKRVSCFVRGTGPSGASGFTCKHDRLEQEEFEYDHGDYFGIDHMEDRWIPFLNKPLEEIHRDQGEPRIPRPQTSAPWCLYGLMIALVLIAANLAAAPVRHRLLHAWAAPMPWTLAGDVTDDEGTPLPGVTLTIQDWDTTDGKAPTESTGTAGRFQFANLKPPDKPAQQVRVIATKPGYMPSMTDPPLGAIDHPIILHRKTSAEGPP